MSSRQAKIRRDQSHAPLSVEIGVISSVTESGEVFVELSSLGTTVRAFILSGALVGAQDSAGRKALVLHVGSDIPLVLGLIEETVKQSEPSDRSDMNKYRLQDVLQLEAAKRITLSCGSASISALKSGKIVIRGTEITTRSSGTSKIKGATVKIN